MKEKKKMRQKKKGVKKKIPMRESNSRPLNLQPASLPPQGLIARTILTYMANLNGHELRVAVLAPPITVKPLISVTP